MSVCTEDVHLLAAWAHARRVGGSRREAIAFMADHGATAILVTSLTTAINVRVSQDGNSGSSGGGCTLMPTASAHPLSGLGHLVLPLAAFFSLWIWRRWRA